MIYIKNLCKNYGSAQQNVHALVDASVTIEQGDIFGIIGMSGAGKSTLMRCICMLEKPTSGQILIDNIDVTKLSGKEAIEIHRKMGIVFQGFHLLMQKSVFDNVAFPLTIAKAEKAYIKQRVTELLELVGLSDKAEVYPSNLSGGQQQRVAIARALATNPKFLLCDEPTSALDSFTTKSILELLKEINQKMGVTIIIITHEINVVKSICNRVAVINKGEFVEVGNTKEVFELPQHSVTKLLIGNEVI